LDSMTDKKRSRSKFQQVRLLMGGLAVSLLFVALASGISFYEVNRAHEQTLKFFRRGAQTTYLLGRIGDQVARIQFSMREAAATGKLEGDDIQRWEKDVGVLARRIPKLLNPNERAIWDELLPELKYLLANYRRAFNLLQQGRIQPANAVLDDVAGHAVRVYNLLNVLYQGNRQEVLNTIDRIDQRLGILGLLELVLGIVLGGAILLVWIFVIRIAQGQNRLLREYIIRMEYANRDLDSFAGRVAHDLKNILNPISLTVYNLTRSRGDPLKAEPQILRMERMLANARNLLEGLLAFSRAGRQTDEPARASVAHEVRAVGEELRPAAEEAGARLEIQVAEDLHVACPATLLRIVVSNLVGNAIKFVRGRENRWVKISAQATPGDRVILTVEDSGPGIPQSHLDRIFEPFYRVPGTRIEGTGIGLATVHRIVTAYSGKVEAASELEKGTRFAVELPAAGPE